VVKIYLPSLYVWPAEITLFDFDQCGFEYQSFEIGKFVPTRLLIAMLSPKMDCLHEPNPPNGLFFGDYCCFR